MPIKWLHGISDMKKIPIPTDLTKRWKEIWFFSNDELHEGLNLFTKKLDLLFDPFTKDYASSYTFCKDLEEAALQFLRFYHPDLGKMHRISNELVESDFQLIQIKQLLVRTIIDLLANRVFYDSSTPLMSDIPCGTISYSKRQEKDLMESFTNMMQKTEKMTPLNRQSIINNYVAER